MGPSEDLVFALKQKAVADAFVETGTFLGDTAAWASKYFSQVVTIELSPHYYAEAQARFNQTPVVRAMQGESAKVLRELVPTLKGPAFFWLDAHWSGLDTAGREAECPLLEEIGILNESSADHILLVDDARLFCAPPPLPHRIGDWPGLASVTAALHDGGRRYVVLYEDVFVAMPVVHAGYMSEWLQRHPPRLVIEGRLTRLSRRIFG